METKEVPNAEVGANMFPNIEDDVVVTDAKVNVVVSDVAYDDGLRCCYVNSDDGLRCKNTGSEDTSDQQSTASYKKCRIGGKRLKETPLPFCVLIVSHSKVAFGKLPSTDLLIVADYGGLAKGWVVYKYIGVCDWL